MLIQTLLSLVVLASTSAQAGPAPAPAAAPPAAPPALPSAALRRCGGGLRLLLQAPPGAHLNPDAPARLEVGPAALCGALVRDGARLPWTPQAVDAPLSLEVGLCDDASGACWLATLGGTLPAGRPPRITLLGPPGAAGAAPAIPAPAAAPAAWGAVTEIYDFTAVWCPPCQQMKAEVLEDPANAADLAGLRLSLIDADSPESWPLKDRYAVTGYPTLVAVDAAGQERGRLLGYPGEAALLAWLRGLGAAPTLDQLRAGPPAGVDPGQAAETALDLARRGEGAAAGLWLQAARPDHPAALAARVEIKPEDADLDALTAIGEPGPWIFAALDAAPARLKALGPLLARLPPEQAADALLIAADGVAQADPGAAQALRLGARLIYDGLLTGDLAKDRPLITSVAHARSAAGDLPAALDLLRAAAARFPGEFTFHHAAAEALVGAGRWAEAEVEARAALQIAWGDQRLRAVLPLARALDGQGRRADARAALAAARAEAQVPAPGVEVRTTRYLKKVDDELQRLAADPPK
ncbi:MAG: Thioredoxin [Pseudomonadota bacterium]